MKCPYKKAEITFLLLLSIVIFSSCSIEDEAELIPFDYEIIIKNETYFYNKEISIELDFNRPVNADFFFKYKSSSNGNLFYESKQIYSDIEYPCNILENSNAGNILIDLYSLSLGKIDLEITLINKKENIELTKNITLNIENLPFTSKISPQEKRIIINSKVSILTNIYNEYNIENIQYTIKPLSTGKGDFIDEKGEIVNNKNLIYTDDLLFYYIPKGREYLGNQTLSFKITDQSGQEKTEQLEIIVEDAEFRLSIYHNSKMKENHINLLNINFNSLYLDLNNPLYYLSYSFKSNEDNGVLEFYKTTEEKIIIKENEKTLINNIGKLTYNSAEPFPRFQFYDVFYKSNILEDTTLLITIEDSNGQQKTIEIPFFK